eukprot:366841-Rhodomonas_salina.1
MFGTELGYGATRCLASNDIDEEGARVLAGSYRATRLLRPARYWHTLYRHNVLGACDAMSGTGVRCTGCAATRRAQALYGAAAVSAYARAICDVRY